MSTLDTPTMDVLDRLSIGGGQVQTVTPQLLTYLRGLNYDVSSLESNRTRRLAEIGADKAYQEQKLGFTEGLERRGIAAEFLRRGTPGSSEASRRLTEQRTAEGFRRGDLNQAIAGQQATQQDIYDTGMSSLRRGALERILSTDTEEAIRKAREEAETRQNAALANAQRGMNDTLIAQQKSAQQFYADMLNQIKGMYALPAAGAGGGGAGAMPGITRMGSGPMGSGNETMAGILPEYNIANFRLADYMPKPAAPTPTKLTTKPKATGYTYGAPLLQRSRYS